MFKPSLLVLEVTNRCNANCFHCVHKNIKKFYDMDFDLYKRIIDETKDFAKTVDPNMYGESLLYPLLVEAIEYAHDKGKRTILFTNASLLNENTAKCILKAGINIIRFSVDGCDKDSYETMRQGLSWNNVLSNVKSFMRLKKEGNYRVSVIVKVVETKINRDRIREIVSFWEKRVDHVSVSKQFYVPTPDEVEANPFVTGKGFKCNKMLEHLTVKANGDLVICCHDYLGTYVMADLNEVDALMGFNGKKFDELRKSMLTGEKIPLMCSYCPINT